MRTPNAPICFFMAAACLRAHWAIASAAASASKPSQMTLSASDPLRSYAALACRSCWAFVGLLCARVCVLSVRVCMCVKHVYMC